MPQTRQRALDELKAHMGLPDELAYLWEAVIAFEGYPFRTSGRGRREGVAFTYTVRRSGSAAGQHYPGASVQGYGNEIMVTGKGKSISRSSVELACRRARELGVVKGPKALGVPGAASYLYPMLLCFGVCSATDPEEEIYQQLSL